MPVNQAPNYSQDSHSLGQNIFLSVISHYNSTLLSAIKFHTPSADSVHAQTIAENEIDYVVTCNKSHFSDLSKQIDNLKVLTPSEMMKELEKICTETKKWKRMLSLLLIPSHYTQNYTINYTINNTHTEKLARKSATCLCNPINRWKF